jgi:CheY-like chemotaxis protein
MNSDSQDNGRIITNWTVIAQTAYGLTGDRDKALEAGCDDYIAKPFNHALLHNIVIKNLKEYEDKIA